MYGVHVLVAVKGVEREGREGGIEVRENGRDRDEISWDKDGGERKEGIEVRERKG